MRITVQEISQTDFGDFQLSLTINEDQPFQVEVTNPHTAETEEGFEWYFEEYLREPYTAETRVQREKEQLSQYGISLFQQLFADPEALNLYRKGLQESSFDKLSFEFLGKEKSTSFQAVLWEAIKDPDFEEPLILKGAQFIRTSSTKPLLRAKVDQHPEINLLIVTARPSEENDVEYRTVQRPIIDIITETGVSVKPHILRPGTYLALKEHLAEVKSGYYHIIHFDLHGAVLTYEELVEERDEKRLQFSFRSFGKTAHSFNVRKGLTDLAPYPGYKALLFFESPQKGVAEPVLAKEIAHLIRDARIPVCILNACQSAKQTDSIEETSLGKTLLDEGVNLVLAMRYTVSVTAAYILMKKLYSELFREKSIGEAISLSRRSLYDDRSRNAALGYTIDIEDWVLPIIYQREDVVFSLRDRTAEEERIYYANKARHTHLPPPRFQFVGRDLDILKIEKLLTPTSADFTRRNHLLIKGMLGIGKSALLKYLAAWWRNTNFRGINNCLYLDFRSAPLTKAQFIDKVASQLDNDHSQEFVNTQDALTKEGKLLKTLNQYPYALILDNIFMFEDKEMIEFLAQITGQSFVVYGSVNMEEELGERTFVDNVYQLEGLDQDAAYTLAGRILQVTAEKDIEQLVNGEHKFEFEQLMKLLAGFPSAMELVLPFLKDRTAREVITQFQDGSLPIELP